MTSSLATAISQQSSSNAINLNGISAANLNAGSHVFSLTVTNFLGASTTQNYTLVMASGGGSTTGAPLLLIDSPTVRRARFGSLDERVLSAGF